MSPNSNTKTGPTALNSDLFISPPMNKCSGAGPFSLTTGAASCHPLECVCYISSAAHDYGAGGATPLPFLIFLATPANLWQSIHHGKQRQRQARSKETKENHTKTPAGASRCQPDPDARYQKSGRVTFRKVCRTLPHSAFCAVFHLDERRLVLTSN